MTKTDFLLELTSRLSFLPREEVEEQVSFYSEMIDDRMEAGLSEAEAIAQIGAVEEIVSQTLADTPFARLAKEKFKPKKRMHAWEIILLVLGSPIWLSLGIAAFSVVLSLYISLWAMVISLWAVFVSLVACAVGGALACPVLAVFGHGISAAAMLAAGSVCAGLSILMFFGCKTATKGTLWLLKIAAIGIKNCFIRKEGA